MKNTWYRGELDLRTESTSYWPPPPTPTQQATVQRGQIITIATPIQRAET